MELYADDALFEPHGHAWITRETAAIHYSKQQRPDVDIQRQRNTSIATVAAIAILLQLRTDCRRDSAGPETGLRGGIDAGPGTEAEQRTLDPTRARGRQLRPDWIHRAEQLCFVPGDMLAGG